MSNSETADLPLWVYLCTQLAPVLSIGVFMSPIPTIQKVKSDMTVGNLPLLPYSSMVASTYLWFVYGVLKAEPSIITANGVGFVLGVYYLISFIKFAPASSPTLPGSVLQHLQGVSALMGLATILPVVMPFITTKIDPAESVGKVAVVFCVLLFASPLAALKVVLATKSAKSIPLPFSIASTVNCFMWTVLGLFKMHDPNVYGPNILGLICSLVQVALKVIYYETEIRYHAVSHDLKVELTNDPHDSI